MIKAIKLKLLVELQLAVSIILPKYTRKLKRKLKVDYYIDKKQFKKLKSGCFSVSILFLSYEILLNCNVCVYQTEFYLRFSIGFVFIYATAL